MQTGEGWNTGVVPKAIGGRNLDQASRLLNTVEHFVMFSSIVASAGNEGNPMVTNYQLPLHDNPPKYQLHYLL